MKELLALFAAFFRVGLFTFGGGYAMLPMLQREVVEKHGWATREELLDYFALGQCVPGILAVNTATLVGYRRRKITGAAAGALGVVAPSVIIITLIAAALQSFAHIPAVAHAFAGIRVAVCALIAAAVLKMITANVIKKLPADTVKPAKTFFVLNGIPILLCAAAFTLVGLLGVSPVYIVAGAAVTGLILLRGKKEAA